MAFQSLGTFELVSGRNFAKLIAELQLSKGKYLNVRLTRSWLDKETQDFVEPVFTNLLTVNDLKELSTKLAKLLTRIAVEQKKIGMQS